MANKPANAKQKKWMADIAEWSICKLGMIYGCEYDGAMVQLHHVLGRSAKHNKVAIGHWFVIPVPFWLHDISGNSEYNVTHNKHNFTERFGKQSQLFSDMMVDMEMNGYEVPSQEVYNAIMDTKA